MGNINDMIGVGITEEHAKAAVGTIETGVTATGSAQSDAYTLKAGATQVSTVAASTGVIIPAALPVHSEIRVYNAGANNLSVYPPSGCTINDEAANVAVIVPAGEGASFARLSNTVFGCVGCSDLTATELEYLDGVTAGTVTASKAVVVDANKDVASFRNVTVTNLDAGASGTAGSVDVFPTTAAKGKLAITCTDQTGDTTVSLVAGAMAAARTITIPDPGAAASVLLTTGTATAASVNTAELNYLDIATLGTGAASKAVVLDAGEDYTWPATGILTYGGGAINATGAEITRTCDLSARIVTLAATSLAITEALHEGRTVVLNHTGAASTCTLPAASGSGGRYRFVVGAVNTSNHVIQVANASDIIQGSVNNLDLDAAAQAAYGCAADSDTITLNGSTTGGQVGDFIELEDYAANKWRVFGQLQCPTGSNPATPFSAAVA